MPSPTKHLSQTASEFGSIRSGADSDYSGYESDRPASLTALTAPDLPRRRTTSTIGAIKRPKKPKRLTATTVGRTRTVSESWSSQRPNPTDRLTDIKDPLPSDAYQFASFFDTLRFPAQQPEHVRERSSSMSTLSSSVGSLRTPDTTMSLSEGFDQYSMQSMTTAVNSSIEQESKKMPPIQEAVPIFRYRKPSEDPAWKLDEPIDQVTEEHMEPLYKNRNGNIEELDEENYGDVSNLVSESERSSPHEEHAVVARPHQPRVPIPAIYLSSPPPSPNQSIDTNPLDQTPAIHIPPPADLPRFQPAPILPTTIPMNRDGTTNPSLPAFEPSRPWEGLNDLFLEATKAMNSGYNSLKHRSSRLLSPLNRTETEPVTPPTTPVVGSLKTSKLPTAEVTFVDSPVEISTFPPSPSSPTLLTSPLGSPLATFKITLADRTCEQIEEELGLANDDDYGRFIPLPLESTRWVFLAFGLVGGMVLGSMLSRSGRR